MKNCFNLKGFSLIEIMIVMGLSAVLIGTLGSLISSINAQVSMVSERQEKVDVLEEIRMLRDQIPLCNCLFRNHTLDTTKVPMAWNTFPQMIPSSYELPYPVPPNPCSPRTEAGEIIPQVGANLKGSTLMVESISMENIINTSGDNFSGDLTVQTKSSKTKLAYRPISLKIFFNVVAGSPPNARVFNACGLSVSSGGACPAGMTMIGNPGEFTAYCISSNPEPKLLNFSQAYSHCEATYVDPFRGVGHLCSTSQWLRACYSGIVAGMTGYGANSGEVVAGAADVERQEARDMMPYFGRGPNCARGWSIDEGNLPPRNFRHRCCI